MSRCYLFYLRLQCQDHTYLPAPPKRHCCHLLSLTTSSISHGKSVTHFLPCSCRVPECNKPEPQCPKARYIAVVPHELRMLIDNVGICLGEYELQRPSYREEPIAAQHSVMTKDPTLCISLSNGSNFFARWLTVPHTSDTARSWQQRRAAEKAFRAFRIDLNDQYGR